MQQKQFKSRPAHQNGFEFDLELELYVVKFHPSH